MRKGVARTSSKTNKVEAEWSIPEKLKAAAISAGSFWRNNNESNTTPRSTTTTPKNFTKLPISPTAEIPVEQQQQEHHAGGQQQQQLQLLQEQLQEHHQHHQQQQQQAEMREGNLTTTELNGLNVAGVAVSMLTTVFSLFHPMYITQLVENDDKQEDDEALEDQMEHHRKIPKMMIYCVINPIIILAMAWYVDQKSLRGNRKDLVRNAGIWFAMSFVLPFYIPLTNHAGAASTSGGDDDPTENLWSLNLFDLLFVYNSIVLGSILTDSHNMKTEARIHFMWTSELMYLFVSLIVPQFGLPYFYVDTIVDETSNRRYALMGFFRFLVGVAMTALLLFFIAQKIISSVQQPNPDADANNNANAAVINIHRRPLAIRRVMKDILHLENFWCWVLMEVLIKAQNSFASYFLYVFLDQLSKEPTEQILHHHLAPTTTFSNFGSIYIISISKQVVTILAYLTMLSVGYRRVYSLLFDATCLLAIFVFTVGDDTSHFWLAGYTLIFTTVSRGVQAAGGLLVMCDLVTELKYKQTIQEHRESEPSSAGLMLGINIFFARPTRVNFAALAEYVSKKMEDESGDFLKSTNNQHPKRILFYLLLAVPILCSLLQSFVWKHFDLTPTRVQAMKEKLKSDVGYRRWSTNKKEMELAAKQYDNV